MEAEWADRGAHRHCTERVFSSRLTLCCIGRQAKVTHIPQDHIMLHSDVGPMGAWQAQRREPELCPFLDQSALNHLLRGNQFAALSPRCNFMGDFHILDLEEEIRPFIYHFVNHPKPWSPDYQGDPRFAALYADPSPAPKLAKAKPEAVDRQFRQKLLDFLAAQSFVDA